MAGKTSVKVKRVRPVKVLKSYAIWLSDLGIAILNQGCTCSIHRDSGEATRHPYMLVPGHSPSGESSVASARRASRVLRDGRTGILARALAGSVLSQAPNRVKGKVVFWVATWAKTRTWYWRANLDTGTVTCHDSDHPNGYAVAASPSEMGGPRERKADAAEVKRIRSSWPKPDRKPAKGRGK